MRIAVILPRGMTFSAEGASAIDLCVRDFVRHSRFSATTAVIGEAVSRPFADIDFRAIPSNANRKHSESAALFAEAARAYKPDLVVVHQHLPIATSIAQHFSPLPILLHKHNLPHAGNALTRWRHTKQYARFCRTIWVSDDARHVYELAFPQLAERAVTIYNGLDFSVWKPARTRTKEILIVGRASPEKGILEAVQACVAILPYRPNWSLRLILSRLDHDDSYLQSVTSTLSPIRQQATLETDQPHDVVKQAYENAAIAVVPSLFREPFGRTALEAMAGGSALISSIKGGLAEILAKGSGYPLSDVTVENIGKAVSTLIDDPVTRETIAHEGRSNAREHFDIENVAKKLDDTYETTCGSN